MKNHLLFKERLLSCNLKIGVLKAYPSHRTNCLVHILTIKMQVKSTVLYYEVTEQCHFLLLLCAKDYTLGENKSPRKVTTNNLSVNTELFNNVFSKTKSF